jgi:Protein of unknown function (DUF2637)
VGERGGEGEPDDGGEQKLCGCRGSEREGWNIVGDRGQDNVIHVTRTHRILVGIVVAGAVIIAGIGFAGSYAAVRTLALHKGFGWFANVFPIGVDAGIVVLLALDLLLTWLRIPFPLLRQTAWLLTAATIAFNGAAAWPDGLGVGMHAIIPVLFVVSVEAARHAIGRIADITADKHMESVRITRWLLAPLPTFRLWRRMKLWELHSYEETIRREQDRLVYRARLRARYGIAWRRKAPVEAIMPLRLAKYGVPLAETADAGLQAAGIDAPATLWSQPVPTALEQHSVDVQPLDERPVPESVPQEYPSGGTVAQNDPEPPGFHEPSPPWQALAAARAAQYAEALAAHQARSGTRTVHARLPAQHEAEALPEAEVLPDAEVLELFQHVEDAADEEVESLPSGKAGLRVLFQRLTPAERDQPDNQLAPKLAAQVGSSVGTARKYLGAIRREAG